MKESFQIDRSDGKIYAMGVTAVAGGIQRRSLCPSSVQKRC